MAPAIVIAGPDADVEGRWTAWKARGRAHERVVRRRAIIAAAAGAAYGPLSW